MRNRACRRITIVKKMTTLSVFRSRLNAKICFKKIVICLAFGNPSTEIPDLFFALPVSVIIVHVDLCGLFREVRT